MTRPSVRDVAERAGVSVGTVSHVLNHPDRVAQSTLDRVRAAIDELGFVRSETAHRLRHGGSSLVGVLVHDISNPFFTEAARGIEDRLREDGRVPMLGSTDSAPERERELMSLLASLDVRGVIVTPSASTLDNLAVLAGRGIRVVLMDHPPISAELPTVSGDDVAGARTAVAHLLDLGHRRIGFVNGPLTVRQSVDRHDGVITALTEGAWTRRSPSLRSRPSATGRASRRTPVPSGRRHCSDATRRRQRCSAPTTSSPLGRCGRSVDAGCAFPMTPPSSVTTISPSPPSSSPR